MNRQELAAACCVLGAMLAGPGVQAQEVHKCTIDGHVTYQPKPCPGADVVVPMQSGPSAQEVHDAQRDLARQRLQAAVGRPISPVQHAYAAPPPPPPPPSLTPPAPPPRRAEWPAMVVQTASPTVTTTTTTTTTDNGVDTTTHSVTRTTKTTRTTSPSSLPPPVQTPPASNCEELDRENSQALDRREQLKAPSELTTRQQILANLDAELARLHDLAKASNCRLKR